MRAAVVETPAPIARRPLLLRELPDPKPGPGEIVIEVAACGVCRTDLQLAEGDLAAHRLPLVPGHQAVGRVVLVGAGVAGWSVGDRAGIAWLGSACGTCERCAAGHENLCGTATFTGWDRDGGFAERVAVRADFALHLPAGFDFVDAAPLLCGGVIGFRALNVSEIEAGQRLGLYGFGASALLTLQVALHRGCEVFVCTRSAAEQERALAMGAAWAGGYEATPPALLHAAITFAPVGDVVVAALRAVDRGGSVVINAIHLDRIPEFSYDLLWWERSIRSVANFTREDASAFLDLAARIPLKTVVDRYPLAQVNGALADLAAGRVLGAAVLEMRESGARDSVLTAR